MTYASSSSPSLFYRVYNAVKFYSLVYHSFARVKVYMSKVYNKYYRKNIRKNNYLRKVSYHIVVHHFFLSARTFFTFIWNQLERFKIQIC